MSVVKVASKLQCEEILYRALDKINRLAPTVERLLIGREHNRREIVLTAFCELINRFEPLKLEEIARLPIEDIAVITARRERRLMDAVPTYTRSEGLPIARVDQVEACCWGRLPPSTSSGN